MDIEAVLVGQSYRGSGMHTFFYVVYGSEGKSIAGIAQGKAIYFYPDGGPFCHFPLPQDLENISDNHLKAYIIVAFCEHVLPQNQTPAI